MFEDIKHYKRQRYTWSLDAGNNVYYEGLFSDDWLTCVVSVSSYQRYCAATYRATTVFNHQHRSETRFEYVFAIDLPTKKEIVTFKLTHDMKKVRNKWRINRSESALVRTMFETHTVNGEITKQQLLELEANFRSEMG